MYRKKHARKRKAQDFYDDSSSSSESSAESSAWSKSTPETGRRSTRSHDADVEQILRPIKVIAGGAVKILHDLSEQNDFESAESSERARRKQKATRRVNISGRPILKRSYTHTRPIDSRGGKLHLFDCEVAIPRNALRKTVEIKLKTKFVEWNEDKSGGFVVFGPQIVFGPSGTAFQEPVVVSVSSCYHRIPGNEPPRVIVQTGRSWDEHERTTLDENGKFIFSVVHFSPYRSLLRLIGVEKTIAHMIFTRRNALENEYEMVWYFCDNLGEVRMEVKDDMTQQGYHLTKSTETLPIEFNDDVRVSLQIPESQVRPRYRMIPSNDIFSPGSMVKVEFMIGNPRRESRISYRIDLIKAGQNRAPPSRPGTFSFLPDTENMGRRGPGGGSTFINPVIDRFEMHG